MAKEIQITAPVATVLAELDRSAAEEAANARRRSRARWGIAGSVLSLVVGITSAAAVPPLGSSLVGLGLVALMVYIVLYLRYKGPDFADRKRDIARQFFAVLAQDIPWKARCRVQLNDDGFEKHGQVSEKTGGIFSDVKTVAYQDPWSFLAGRLHDGSAFKITITQLVKRKSTRKRKYTKIRERHREKVSLALRLDPAIYPGLAQLPVQWSGSSVGGMEITRAQMVGNVLHVTAITGIVPRFHGRSGWSDFNVQGLVTGPRLLDLLVFIYSKLAGARKESVQPS